jgi:hypothetical protein
MYENVYQVVNKQTGKVVSEGLAYEPLDKDYADSGHLYFIRNTQTGVEWEIPE